LFGAENNGFTNIKAHIDLPVLNLLLGIEASDCYEISDGPTSISNLHCNNSETTFSAIFCTQVVDLS
jgi:hypothetical protein